MAGRITQTLFDTQAIRADHNQANVADVVYPGPQWLLRTALLCDVNGMSVAGNLPHRREDRFRRRRAQSQAEGNPLARSAEGATVGRHILRRDAKPEGRNVDALLLVMPHGFRPCG